MNISTEKELNQAVEQVIQKYDLDIDVSVEIANFKRKAGQYRHDEKKVRISNYLLENHPEKVLDTIKHELGHALAEQRNKDIKPHGKEWRAAMAEINVYNPDVSHEMQLADHRYTVSCTNPDCDVRYGRYRRSKLVKQPELYKCGECGSELESSKV